MSSHYPWDIRTLPNWARVPVPEVDASKLTRDQFFADYVARWQPVVVKGACRHWIAVEKWRHPDYLRQRWGDTPVPIHLRAKPLMSKHPDAQAHIRKGRISGKFSDLLDDDPSEPDRSLRHWPIEEGAPLGTMLSDLGSDRLVADTPPPRRYPRRRLLLYRGGISLWHFHGTDEHLTYQLVGTKRFALLGPDQDAKVRRSATRELYSLDADPARYPEYFSMVPLSCEVQAGDAIYLPPVWWHTVQPVDKELGATFAFTWATSLAAYARNLRSVKPALLTLLDDPLYLWRPRIIGWRRRLGALRRGAPSRAPSTSAED
jgi:Cupin-like domain